jgi:hypothetical protein
MHFVVNGTQFLYVKWVAALTLNNLQGDEAYEAAAALEFTPDMLNPAMIFGFIVVILVLLAIVAVATWGCYGVYKQYKKRSETLYPEIKLNREANPSPVCKWSLAALIFIGAINMSL